MILFGYDNTKNKSKFKQVGFYQAKMFLHTARHHTVLPRYLEGGAVRQDYLLSQEFRVNLCNTMKKGNNVLSMMAHTCNYRTQRLSQEEPKFEASVSYITQSSIQNLSHEKNKFKVLALQNNNLKIKIFADQYLLKDQ